MHLSETVLLLMAMLTIGVLISGLFSKLPVPYTVLLVVVGMVIGNLAEVWEPLAPVQQFHLSPELVFFVFLPALLFESGLSLNARQLGKDLLPVLMLAVPALLVSTTLVGLGVWMLLPISLPAALLFGALISATDPVAVVSLFKELGTPMRLMVLVEGESLLNDATAIVLFSILLGLATTGTFALGDVGGAALSFLRVFVGGIVVGALSGVVVSWMTIRLHLEISAVLICSVVLAYVSFIVAEHVLHVSGVMAVVAAAIVYGMLAMPRLSTEVGHGLHETWEFLAETTNTLLFLMIGMTVDLSNLLNIFLTAVVVSVLVILSRASTVYTVVPVTVALFKLPRISFGERHIMWWGGLKGGLAIAIALSIPADFPGREMLLDLTLGVVLFSLLVNAPTIRPLIKWLGLDRLSETEQVELTQTAAYVNRRTDEVLKKFVDNRVLSRAGHYQAEREVDECLDWPNVPIPDSSLARKRLLDAIRVESRELDSLFSAGVIPQYTFLDVKTDLQGRRDAVLNAERFDGLVVEQRPNWFQRFEKSMIRRLREFDWAAGLLASYQNLRIPQQIVRSMVKILMAESALEYLEQREAQGARIDAAIVEQYRQQLARLHLRIADFQRDFGEFYQRFETRFAKKAALVSVLRDVESELRKGAISTKVFVVLEHAISRALDEIPAASKPLASLPKEDLLAMVPMLEGLERAQLSALAAKASLVNFLVGDVIIGEGEHGDAMYVLAKGRVKVSVRDGDSERELKQLGVGDCFGEMAMLGDHVRRATVTALHACTLLRLRAGEVKEIASRVPEIGAHIEALNEQRKRELDALST